MWMYLQRFAAMRLKAGNLFLKESEKKARTFKRKMGRKVNKAGKVKVISKLVKNRKLFSKLDYE